MFTYQINERNTQRAKTLGKEKKEATEDSPKKKGDRHMSNAGLLGGFRHVLEFLYDESIEITPRRSSKVPSFVSVLGKRVYAFPSPLTLVAIDLASFSVTNLLEAL